MQKEGFGAERQKPESQHKCLPILISFLSDWISFCSKYFLEQNSNLLNNLYVLSNVHLIVLKQPTINVLWTVGHTHTKQHLYSHRLTCEGDMVQAPLIPQQRQEVLGLPLSE